MTGKRKRGAMRLKRVYEAPAADDGVRVLVDRLWPRGISKATAKIDHWLKDIAPSTELRREFHDQPSRWAEFVLRYRAELRENPDALAVIDHLLAAGVVTLLYAARDVEHNNAVALKDVLEARRR